MVNKPTTLATSIFAAIQAQNRKAVFLAEQDGHPTLGFGENSTRIVFYLVQLRWGGQEIQLVSSEHPTFALMMDTSGAHSSARLVLYTGERPEPTVEFGGDGEYQQLSGQIIIRAKDQDSEGQVAIHAVFGGDGANSIAIDMNPQFTNHLTAAAALIAGRNVRDLF